MIGVYDYTVILTYLSAIIAGVGMLFAAEGNYEMAVLMLALCGMFDMLDGPVARTKKDRTKEQKAFGIQIDSFCDLIAFGVFPSVIAYSISPSMTWEKIILLLFPLCGLIRLAYFNVSEMTRQEQTEEKRKSYTGLPITVSAIVFPILTLIRAWVPKTVLSDQVFYIIYLVFMVITMILFITPFRVPKPGKRGIIFFVILGVVAITGYLIRIFGIV